MTSHPYRYCPSRNLYQIQCNTVIHYATSSQTSTTPQPRCRTTPEDINSPREHRTSQRSRSSVAPIREHARLQDRELKAEPEKRSKGKEPRRRRRIRLYTTDATSSERRTRDRERERERERNKEEREREGHPETPVGW